MEEREGRRVPPAAWRTDAKADRHPQLSSLYVAGGLVTGTSTCPSPFFSGGGGGVGVVAVCLFLTLPLMIQVVRLHPLFL